MRGGVAATGGAHREDNSVADGCGNDSHTGFFLAIKNLLVDIQSAAVATNARRLLVSSVRADLLILEARGHNLPHPSSKVIDGFVFDSIASWIRGPADTDQ